MALFQEKRIVTGGQYEQMKLQELGIGESVTLFIKGFREGTNDEFGDYVIAQGLALDVDESDETAFVNNAYLASFILNTMLSNMRNDGKLEINKIYRLEKAWDRGQKLKSGKKAKGFGYEVFNLEVAPSLIQKLVTKHDALLSQQDSSDIEEDNEIPTSSTKRPAL